MTRPSRSIRFLHLGISIVYNLLTLALLFLTGIAFPLFSLTSAISIEQMARVMSCRIIASILSNKSGREARFPITSSSIVLVMLSQSDLSSGSERNLQCETLTLFVSRRQKGEPTGSTASFIHLKLLKSRDLGASLYGTPIYLNHDLRFNPAEKQASKPLTCILLRKFWHSALLPRP